eukprot:m.39452 g.39452  ORF g.39452 m.39452 type:complete len:720 (-) comp18203_c0_seq1:238-2397(-)
MSAVTTPLQSREERRKARMKKISGASTPLHTPVPASSRRSALTTIQAIVEPSTSQSTIACQGFDPNPNDTQPVVPQMESSPLKPQSTLKPLNHTSQKQPALTMFVGSTPSGMASGLFSSMLSPDSSPDRGGVEPKPATITPQSSLGPLHPSSIQLSQPKIASFVLPPPPVATPPKSVAEVDTMQKGSSTPEVLRRRRSSVKRQYEPNSPPDALSNELTTDLSVEATTPHLQTSAPPTKRARSNLCNSDQPSSLGAFVNAIAKSAEVQMDTSTLEMSDSTKDLGDYIEIASSHPPCESESQPCSEFSENSMEDVETETGTSVTQPEESVMLTPITTIRQSNVKRVVLHRELKRSIQEDLLLQKQMCEKATQISRLLANQDTSLTALKHASYTNTAESLRLRFLEEESEKVQQDTDKVIAVTSTPNPQHIIINGMWVDVKDIADVQDGAEAFLVFRTRHRVFVTDAIKIHNSQLKVPEELVFEKMEFDFVIEVTLFVMKANVDSIENEPMEPPTPTKVKDVMLKKLKSAHSRLGTQLHLRTRAKQNKSPREPFLFVERGTLDFSRKDLKKNAIAFQTPKHLASSSSSTTCDQFELNFTISTQKYLKEALFTSEISMFERSGSSAGSWKRRFAEISDGHLKIWQQQRNREVSQPVYCFPLTTYTTSIVILKRSVCARPFSFKLDPICGEPSTEVRFACDFEEDLGRWVKHWKEAVAEAHAWL